MFKIHNFRGDMEYADGGEAQPADASVDTGLGRWGDSPSHIPVPFVNVGCGSSLKRPHTDQGGLWDRCPSYAGTDSGNSLSTGDGYFTPGISDPGWQWCAICRFINHGVEPSECDMSVCADCRLSEPVSACRFYVCRSCLVTILDLVHTVSDIEEESIEDCKPCSQETS